MAVKVLSVNQANNQIKVTFEVSRWFRKTQTHFAYGEVGDRDLACRDYKLSFDEKLDLIRQTNAIVAEKNYLHAARGKSEKS